MNDGIISLLVFGAIASLATVVGGILLISAGTHRHGRGLLKYLVALGAGFMLAAIFIEMLPETFALWAAKSTGPITGATVAVPATLLLVGYLVVHFFEHTVAPHFHFGEETHPEAMLSPTAAYSAIGGLAIHAVFDGVSIAAAFAVNFRLGLLVFVAILLHKMPEGFTVASIMLASGRSSRKALLATLILGLATFLGVISIIVLRNEAHNSVAYALPFSCGVTLYVAASDLIPEVNHGSEKNPLVPVIVFVGVALFYLLHKLLEG